MKAPFLASVALVALTFAGVAQAGPGPTSPLYLSSPNYTLNILVVQGNSIIQNIPTAYGTQGESPIAVWGDIRTTGAAGAIYGGQYTLAGIPTGTTYILPGAVSNAYDSTSDGSHNYLVDFDSGAVYQTARDFTNPVLLFNSNAYTNVGITYDATNNSLWVSGWDNNFTVADYSLNGTLLSSFSIGHDRNAALALDPADHTLWLVNDNSYSPNYGYLEQYSTAGVLLDRK